MSVRSSGPRACSRPSTLIPTSTPASIASRDLAGVERFDRGRHLGHLPAEARAERAVVGLHLVADQLGFLGDELQLLDVELRGHDSAPCRDRLSLGVVGDHDCPPQRLADLDPGLRACRATKLDRAPHGLHRSLELLVDERGIGLREVAQMHRVRHLAELLVCSAGEIEWISSARKGVNGASSAAVSSRHRRRVANASRSPSQKRRRESRTYQLESSST